MTETICILVGMGEEEKEFFVDWEEGHDGIVNGIEACNLSGWLVPKDKANI